MGKNKLHRFAEIKTFPNVFQPSFDDIIKNDFNLKGKWQQFFNNNNPLVLELGCGKGEYTVGLARLYPEKNFIGIDIKGARLWRGARQSNDENMRNVAFIRTHVELITSFFTQNEVDEIWITFPDPQLKKRRKKKRLTSSRFLCLYQQILKNNGFVHLKTDNAILHKYTAALLKYNNIQPEVVTDNLYHSGYDNDILSIKTFYEQQFLAQGIPITYIKFMLNQALRITEMPDDE